MILFFPPLFDRSSAVGSSRRQKREERREKTQERDDQGIDEIDDVGYWMAASGQGDGNKYLERQR